MTNETDIGDDDVIRRVLAGDREPFRWLVQRHAAGIRMFLSTAIRNRTEVEDLSQETFIAAYRALSTYRTGAGASAWLRGIARNKLMTHLQRRYRDDARGGRELALAEVATEEHHEPPAIDAVRRCLDALPERMRDVVSARHLRREAVTAIALRLGSTVNAISTLLSRARRDLRTCMERAHV